MLNSNNMWFRPRSAIITLYDKNIIFELVRTIYKNDDELIKDE